MLGRTGGHEARFQRRLRSIQEAKPWEEGQYRRHNVPDAGEVFEQSGGTDTRKDGAVGRGKEED